MTFISFLKLAFGLNQLMFVAMYSLMILPPTLFINKIYHLCEMYLAVGGIGSLAEGVQTQNCVMHYKGGQVHFIPIKILISKLYAL